MSEAIKASGDEGIKRKFSDLFQRLDGVATIDSRSFEAVLMDPAVDAMGGRAGEERRAGPSGPRSPLQTMKVKGRLGANPDRERESREREQLDLLEDIEANKSNTDPR